MPVILQEACEFYCQEIDERTDVTYNWAESLDWYLGDTDGVKFRDRVDLIGFASWACNQMKWDTPKEFKELVGQDLSMTLKSEDSEKPLSPKELNNLLKLIGALYETIIDKGLYKSDEELKAYLENEYQSLSGFSKRNLDSKLSAAKKAINQNS